MKLLLFDIDGTLIHSGGAGKDAMERAFEKVYGAARGLEGIPLMGRTDPSIVREALRLRGLEARDEEIAKFREFYFWFLEEEIEKPRPGKGICPGIPALLTALQEKPFIETGLLTGNWRYGGTLKLRHFGLDGFFKVGAFADDSMLREELVPVAVDRFEKTSGIRPDPGSVYVIGDTPLDIHCAKPHGVKSVAVATGVHSLEALEAESPDHLFRDFTDTEAVLRIFDDGEKPRG